VLGEWEAALDLPQPFFDAILPRTVGVTVRPKKHGEMVVIALKFFGTLSSLDSWACRWERDCFEGVHD